MPLPCMIASRRSFQGAGFFFSAGMLNDEKGCEKDPDNFFLITFSCWGLHVEVEDAAL